MKERLKELLRGKSIDQEVDVEYVADFLLSDGVIVPPCKVGQTVYCKDGAWDVVGFDCNRANCWSVKLERWKDRFWDFHEHKKVAFSSFGKRVFFSREEAEKAFERSENG